MFKIKSYFIKKKNEENNISTQKPLTEMEGPVADAPLRRKGGCEACRAWSCSYASLSRGSKKWSCPFSRWREFLRNPPIQRDRPSNASMASRGFSPSEALSKSA